jgi:hypothetical protein
VVVVVVCGGPKGALCGVLVSAVARPGSTGAHSRLARETQSGVGSTLKAEPSDAVTRRFVRFGDRLAITNRRR